MKTQTYSDLLRQYYDWQWEAEIRLAHEDATNYVYACKQMAKFKRLMRDTPSKNLIKEAA